MVRFLNDMVGALCDYFSEAYSDIDVDLVYTSTVENLKPEDSKQEGKPVIALIIPTDGSTRATIAIDAWSATPELIVQGLIDSFARLVVHKWPHLDKEQVGLEIVTFAEGRVAEYREANKDNPRVKMEDIVPDA